MMNINEILTLAADHKASDIHLTVGLPPVLRINKELVYLEADPLTPEDIAEMMYSIMTDKQKELFREKLEYDFSYGLKGLARFRVNVFMQRGSVAAAFRRIPFEIPPLDSLGVPKIAHKIIEEERGFVLVTGPTGHGKSTTLAAMIDEINMKFSKHIVTIEDPIEYLFRHKRSVVVQRELGSDTLSFPSALRAALREDPDVILVGEMRDLDTISTALTAAETGHLVFATLHTNSAAQSIDRIVDVFPPHQQEQVKMQLSSVLLAIFSQQLIQKKDKKGLVLATEVLIATPAVRNLIREGKTHMIPSIIQTSSNVGMQTMEQSLKELVLRGDITYEDGLRYAFNKENFVHLMER
ncbi:twitching motility protein [Caldisericum exile AZM16c01]|uniref:Twitching motility protein n=2 Tax=Caldisericum exile TaxID=693075 RepID=A0A7U6GFV2_CALEA|nr:type IV pilus twitching motility protein PilT [Caldisericum exile]BAL81599.1 twitching motility protein [Caldisericum exile AZM16c01]